MHFTKPFHQKAVVIVIVIFSLLLPLVAPLSSCNKSDWHNEKYYDDFFTNQDELYTNGKTLQAKANVDSLYYTTKSPSGYFQYKRMSFKSRHYFQEEKKDSAEKYADSAILVIEKNELTQKYPYQYAEALNARGDYYYSANEIDKAFEYFSRGYQILNTLKDNIGAIGNEAYHLGMVTYKQEKYDEALKYFKQAYYGISRCAPDSNNYYWQQQILCNIALSYTRLENNDSAKYYYNKALEYVQTESQKYKYSIHQEKLADVAIGVIMGNMAKVYSAMNITDTAEQLLKKSIAINARPGYENYDAEFSNMQLAELYYKKNNLQDAYAILQQLRSALDTMKNTDVEMRWRKLMYYYYLNKKQPELAGGYMSTFLELKDSSDKAGKKLKKIDYAQLLKEQDEQYKLKLLTKDNEFNQLYLWLTIGFAAAAIIIMGLVATNYRRSRKNVIALTQLNNRINEQNVTLAQALDDLKSSNEDKDRILQTVAHDLRNPISAVAMIGGFLATTENNEVKKKELNIIVRASHSMLTLTEELLKFSSGASEEDKDNKELIDIREIITQVVSLLQFKAEEKKQEIKLITPTEQVNSYVSREQITRIFSNLVSNAIKFSRKNSEIEISLQIINNNIQIKVTDNGIGIPREFLTKIFDPFTQAKRHGTAGERSFGLGLSICKQIVEDHRGKIWATSTEGKGSNFFIELPLA